MDAGTTGQRSRSSIDQNQKAAQPAAFFVLIFNPYTMIYFLWSLLNLGALVCFLFICFSVLKPIRENLGMAAVIIFVVGCMSFIKGTVSNDGQEPNSRDDEKMEKSTIDSKLFYDLDLIYFYKKDSSATQVRSFVAKNGLVIGHEWKSLADDKVYFKGDILHYSCSGIHEWKLLGLTLYKEPQTFTGTIKPE